MPPNESSHEVGTLRDSNYKLDQNAQSIQMVLLFEFRTWLNWYSEHYCTFSLEHWKGLDEEIREQNIILHASKSYFLLLLIWVKQQSLKSHYSFLLITTSITIITIIGHCHLNHNNNSNNNIHNYHKKLNLLNWSCKI